MYSSKRKQCLQLYCAFLTVVCSVTSSCSESLSHSQACVIGAGYSGLGTMRYLLRYGVNVTALEATRYIGGTWRYEPKVGTDSDGIPVYTSMYKGLRTNTPRQTMEYAGFPFPANTKSYPSGPCFYKYLKSFAKHYDLLRHIRLTSLVTSIDWADNYWKVTHMKTDTKQNYTQICDYVIICNGQRYSKPKIPWFKGLDTFSGNVIHSHDYREPKPFTNRTVLVIGAGPSGLDLATILSKVATKIIHSHHRSFINDSRFPENYFKKPDVESFSIDSVTFLDGSTENIDDVILCTGYLIDHSFLSKNTGVVSTSNFTLPLYNQIVNIIHPSMLFVGLAKRVFPRILDLQAEYAASLIAKKFELPSQTMMMRNWYESIQEREVVGKKIGDMNTVDRVDPYMKKLCTEAGTPSPPPVLLKMRESSNTYRYEDWTNFRDYKYDAVDEENYVRTYEPAENLDCPNGL